MEHFYIGRIKAFVAFVGELGVGRQTVSELPQLLKREPFLNTCQIFSSTISREMNFPNLENGILVHYAPAKLEKISCPNLTEISQRNIKPSVNKSWVELWKLSRPHLTLVLSVKPNSIRSFQR